MKGALRRHRGPATIGGRSTDLWRGRLFGIRVNVVSPFAATEGVLQWQEAFPERAAASIAKVPLGRIGDPETDIAPIVVFLASESSRYMTGQTLMADGGSVELR